MTTPFWVDHDYDEDRASHGTSRYGSYLRRNQRDLLDALDYDGPARFAAECWRIATSPVMSPGYVRWCPRILEARVIYNAWDGSLVSHIALVAPRPEALADLSGDWHGWPVERAWGGPEWYREPGEEELTHGRYLLPSVLLAFPVPTARLAKPDVGDDLLPVAQDTVALLVSELNQVIEPVLGRMEQS